MCPFDCLYTTYSACFSTYAYTFLYVCQFGSLSFRLHISPCRRSMGPVECLQWRRVPPRWTRPSLHRSSLSLPFRFFHIFIHTPYPFLSLSACLPFPRFLSNTLQHSKKAN